MRVASLRINRAWAGAVALTLTLQLLVVSAATGELSHSTLVVLSATAGAVGFFHVTFGSSPLTVTVLANLLAVYTCFFLFMLRYNFPAADDLAVLVAYLLPILGLLLGAWLRRAEIGATKVNRHGAEGKSSGFPFAWLVPMVMIAVATLVPPTQELGAGAQSVTLLIMMGVVAVFVLVMSPSVIAFILYTGEVFRGFFNRLSRLAAPAIAFLSLYTLIVIVFACLYRMLDKISQAPTFAVAGDPRPIEFTEALYFSVVTMSTVGYGDITPLQDPIRVLVALEIVLGVLLLLFGFAEIMKYARDPGGGE